MEENGDCFKAAKQRGDTSGSKTSARCPQGPSEGLRGSVNPESMQQSKLVYILPELSNSGWRVKDDLCSIHTKHEPVQRVVPPIADIHSNRSKLCLKHWVSCISFHIVSRLETQKQKATNADFLQKHEYLPRCFDTYPFLITCFKSLDHEQGHYLSSST